MLYSITSITDITQHNRRYCYTVIGIESHIKVLYTPTNLTSRYIMHHTVTFETAQYEFQSQTLIA